jgi:CubicO group peptidase (beta-lactamase class C family)
MAAESFFAEDPREVGLDPARVEALFERAAREVVSQVLPSTQIAIARRGKIAAMRTVGLASSDPDPIPATNQTVYPIFSCTKAIIAAAAWLLIGDGLLDVRTPVKSFIPEFAAGGKDDVTVEHLMTHSAGFPYAGMTAGQWRDRSARLEQFASWRLEWPPGSRFTYHPTSSFWVVAEIIERCTGQDFREFVRDRIAVPLGLALDIGLARDYGTRLAVLQYVGHPPDADSLAQVGLPPTFKLTVDEGAILSLNEPGVRELGVPGGGGVMTAADLALFYQSLLAHLDRDLDDGLWRRDVLIDAMRVRFPDHTDPILGMRVNRALGVVIAGDDGQAVLRGFGFSNSPLIFGHGGAGGQIGWADPATGISVAYFTNGIDREFIRQGKRGAELSTMAAGCAA